MRKALFAVTALLIFMMAGCDMFGGDAPADVPVLQLVGDIDTTIGLNEEYTDPGVTILGDFDLEVTTESTLDITTYGTYYIYYSVEFDGETYTMERRIRVVRDTEKDFNIELSVVSVEPNSLTFSISLDDEAGALQDGKATLYLLDAKIGEYPITSGVNTLEFTGLSNFTFYRLEFTGSFLEAGESYSLNSYTLGAKTTVIPAADYPRLELVGDAEIHLGLGNTYTEQGVTIIGDQQELEITTTSNVNIHEAGTYVVVYTIVFNETTIYAHRTVVVEPAGDSEFAINVEVTETNAYSLEVSVTVDDPDSLLSGAFGVLYIGETEVTRFVYTDGTTTMLFTMLLPGTIYNFVLEGSYMEDGSAVSIGDYGVETSTEEINDLQPVLVLVGDSIMDVDLNSTFTDPGAEVIGDPNITIDVETYLQMTIPGTYVINYSATVNGTYYSVYRTVNVINPGALDFDVSLSLTSTTETSITYSLDVDSNFLELTGHTAQLYDGATFVGELQFGSGNTVLEFTNLNPETEYTLIVIGEYMLHGFLESMGEYRLNATTMDASAPVVSLTSYEIGIDYIDTVININDEYSQITYSEAKIYLVNYQELGWLIIAGDNAHNFDYLAHSTTYRLVVEYTYVPYGETTPIDVSIEFLEFTTLTPPMPTLDSIDCDIQDTFITCDAVWDTDGFSSVGAFAQIWHNDTYSRVIWFENGNSTLFVDDLDPETDYILKIFVDYVVDDTSSRYIAEITNVSAITLRPVPKTVPVIENIVYTYTASSITVDFDILDPTFAFDSGILRLYRGWTAVENFDYVEGHNTVTFDNNLYDNEEYKLEFRMTYDINEEYIHTNEFITSVLFDIPADIDLETFAPKEMYFTNDHVILQIDLDNDEEVDVEFVTIDGVRYTTYKFPSNPERIYVDMGVRTAGTYHFSLDNVGLMVNDEEYTYDYEYELTMQVYVPGSIDPDDAEVIILDITTAIVGGSPFVSITGDEGYEEAEVDIYIHLENKYNLEVTALNIYNDESAT